MTAARVFNGQSLELRLSSQAIQVIPQLHVRNSLISTLQRLHHQEKALALRHLLLRAGEVGGEELGRAGVRGVRLQAVQQVREGGGEGGAGEERQPGVRCDGQPSAGSQMGQSWQNPGKLIYSSSE